MPRRPPRLLVIASAVLLAGVVVLWAMSYRHAFGMRWRSDASFPTTLFVWHGLLCYSEPMFFSEGAAIHQGLGWFSDPADEWRVDGAGASPWFHGGLSFVAAPLWALGALVGMPLAWAAVTPRRFPPGRCRSCGYDLTANASGRCPERGSTVALSRAEISA